MKMDVRELEKKYCVDILISTKDRHSELYGLLMSLQYQTFQNFNVLIRDESQTPISTHHPSIILINELKFSGHKVFLKDKQQSFGVCYSRNDLIKEHKQWRTGANMVLRLDDDIFLDKQYIEKLLEGIEMGYDLMSGIISLAGQPKFERENKFIGKIINEHKLDKNGSLVLFKDDCGFCYLDNNQIIPTHQFRTNCLMKKEVLEKCSYPVWISQTGFREEGFFSFQAIINNFLIGVHTGAHARHLQTPSGGVRANDYAQKVQSDHQSFLKWVKEMFEEKGDFISSYNEKLKEKGLLK